MLQPYPRDQFDRKSHDDPKWAFFITLLSAYEQLPLRLSDAEFATTPSAVCTADGCGGRFPGVSLPTGRGNWCCRFRCRPCRSSHPLLPDFLFFRRLDEVAVIRDLARRSLPTAGAELRALAQQYDLPQSTLRGWCDRFRHGHRRCWRRLRRSPMDSMLITPPAAPGSSGW